MAELEGKVAIVTGAGSGIGRATTLLFAREGATVIAADLSDGVEETVSLDDTGRVLSVKADAGNEDDVKSLIAKATSEFGKLDIFYANAGISGGWSTIFDQSVEDWQKILQVNLIGPFLAIKHAGPVMRDAGGGAIVCTASVAGIRSGAGGPAYSASKAGVINLVTVGAQQLTGSKVRVNAICPGLIETGMTKPIYESARAAGKDDRIGQLNPLRRGGEPSEIAEVALFLASDRASYVNGHAIPVDGGLSSSHPVVRQTPGGTAT